MGDLIVQKFGGTSLANTPKIMTAATKVAAAMNDGNKVVVVVSAQGIMTDLLINKARHISSDIPGRELDMLLATGEQQSAALLAMGVCKLGKEAISLNAQQVGIKSSSRYGNAEILGVDTKRIIHELSLDKAVIVTGFQGVSEQGDITTLGRGASDTTAVALASVLDAKYCEMYTDVDGIYTADPRMVSTAIKLKSISYNEMIELAASGVKKPHNRAVEMAKKYGVQVLVRSSLNDTSGTWIKEDAGVERLTVSGLAIDRNIARIVVKGDSCKLLDYKLFSKLAENDILVDLISKPCGIGSDLVFTVRKHDVCKTLKVLEDNKENLAFNSVKADENLAKFSAVGAGMSTNCGLAAKILSAIDECGVKIEMIAASEIKMSVLVDEKRVIDAARAVHDKLLPEFTVDEGLE